MPQKNDPKFAKKLASLADLFVNDAFGIARRAHASTEGVTKFLRPSVAGFLLQKAAASLSLLVVSSPYSPVGILFSLLVVACSMSLPPQFFFHVFLRGISHSQFVSKRNKKDSTNGGDLTSMSAMVNNSTSVMDSPDGTARKKP